MDRPPDRLAECVCDDEAAHVMGLCPVHPPEHATGSSPHTMLLAWHDCGKVIAAMVSRPEWPEDAEHRAEFKALQAGRTITETSVRMAPGDDEWCRCFRG